jgi:hypothetical protein
LIINPTVRQPGRPGDEEFIEIPIRKEPMAKTKTKTQTWKVTFLVDAPSDWTDVDIENAVEEALDNGRELPEYLDATFITARKQ